MALGSPSRDLPLGLAASGALAAWGLTGEWVSAVGAVVLWGIWRYMPVSEGPPVIALALSFQWTQVMAGLIYNGLTGRSVEGFDAPQWRVMVLMGLASVAALGLGLRVGADRAGRGAPPAHELAFDLPSLIPVYAALTFVMGLVPLLAWSFVNVTQAILALGWLRLVAFYLLLKLLARPPAQHAKAVGLVLFEVGLGFTGFFADFRDPIILGVLVFLEQFDRRNVRHWLTLGGAGALAMTTGVVWIAIRTPIRKEFNESEAFAASRSSRASMALDLIRKLGDSNREEALSNIDAFVDRVWVIYYPALALDRVPSVLPHEEGRILMGALLHIVTPRVLFPEKAALPSDSEMVRHYSGVWVAGEESMVSIAFGYVGESYIDFGVPLMFVPPFLWGLLLGWLYVRLPRLLAHRDLAQGLITVMFWVGLYLYERSWIKTIGFTITNLIVLGGLTLAVDQFLSRERLAREGARPRRR